MELEFGRALCYTPKFVINGVKADADDFGEQYDRDEDGADDYCCGDMQFTRVDPRPDVLEKYAINEAEYAFIASQLEAGLSFGNCGWCS